MSNARGTGDGRGLETAGAGASLEGGDDDESDDVGKIVGDLARGAV